MKTEKLPSVYVVYPTALFEGWEVVKEPDETPIFFETREAATHYAQARAAGDGAAVVKFENWFGDIWFERRIRAPRTRSSSWSLD